MTRENKLALVIGFGLLLLAGIFVSDHLSAQQRTDEEPLVASEEFVLPGANILKPRNAAAPDSRPGATGLTTPTKPAREIVLGRRKDVPTSSNLTVHVVRSGETLTAISRTHYGDTDRMDDIARQNNITDPNRLVVGMRLVLPPAATAPPVAQAPAPIKTTPTVVPIPSPNTVIVRKGDTLGDIAKRKLGSYRKWREIAEENKDILPDPDLVTPGMILRLPTK